MQATERPAAIGIVKGKPFAPTGARTLDSRTAFYYAYTLDSPGMIMRIPDVGSQYLMGFLYDNQTRSMLQTQQRFPRAGSQTYPTPAAVANADGSTTVYFGPSKPAGVKDGNGIQTVPGKGWFTILRLYGPLEPFFTKKWRPSEIELIEDSRRDGLR